MIIKGMPKDEVAVLKYLTKNKKPKPMSTIISDLKKSDDLGHDGIRITISELVKEGIIMLESTKEKGKTVIRYRLRNEQDRKNERMKLKGIKK